MQKELLVISYYWLPDEGTGSYRISKFVKYLLRKGWQITVLTASQDPEGSYAAPAGLKVMRVGKQKSVPGAKKVNPSIFYAKDQNWKAKLKVWARLNLIIPDAKIFWYPAAVKAGLALAKQYNFAALLSTSPPPSTSLVAKRLAQKLKLPWVADFRDPWTEIYYYEDFPQGAIAKRINKALEKSVLEQADAVVSVNAGFFPEHEGWMEHEHIISNGFDPEDFLPGNHVERGKRDKLGVQNVKRSKGAQGLPKTQKTQGVCGAQGALGEGLGGKEEEKQGELGKQGEVMKFKVAYLGSFKMNQLAPGFLNFLQNLPEGLIPHLEFNFVGNVDVLVQEEIMKLIPKGLELHFKGLVPHKEAVAIMQEADLLLLLIGQAERSKLVFSTKLFEYLMSGNPVLAFGHEGGAAHKVIESSKGGYLSPHGASEAALEYFSQVYKHWQSGRTMPGASPESLEDYNFEKLSARLEKILMDVTG